MKHTTPGAFLTRGTLCWVRDERPTPEAFVGRVGEQGYHLLRKSGAVVVDEGRVRLSLRHLSPDRKRFVWGITVIHLDEDRVELVRWGPGGPPMFAESP